MFKDVSRFDGYPISAGFRLYLRDRIKRTKRFAEYRKQSGCPTFARMTRDDFIFATQGVGLDFIGLFHDFQRNTKTNNKFRGLAALNELDAARAKLSSLGYVWNEKSEKWLEAPKWD